MADKDGSAIRGEPGHFRYKKDMALGNKFDKNGLLIGHGPPVKPTGTTAMDTPGLEKEPEVSSTPKAKGTPDPKGIYTKDVAKGFNKTEQKNLLKARGITFPSTIKERGLVDKILKSNPEGDENPKEERDVPPEPPIPAAENAKFTEAQLEDFKAKKLVEILRSLGIKRIPLSEKGKIKKILETLK